MYLFRGEEYGEFIKFYRDKVGFQTDEKGNNPDVIF